jgi:hypothetical protein
MSGAVSVLQSAGRFAYQLGFELSPIILTGGIATSLGGMLPIVALTETANFVNNLLQGPDLDPDDFFCHFRPMPGAELLSYEAGEYPYANQAVAANAIIKNPLNISFLMDCPVKIAGGYTAKLITFTALKSTLEQHQALGGTYTIVMPTGIIPNCILLNLLNVDPGESKQVQTRWQWNFRKPLLTLEDAQSAQNSLMSQISSGASVTSNQSWAGLQTAINNPSGANAPGLLGVAASLVGTSVASFSQILATIENAIGAVGSAL